MTSFPYLAIAREFKADYGLVLAWSDMRMSVINYDPKESLPDWRRKRAAIAGEQLPDECKTAIDAANWTEYRRRGRVMFDQVAADALAHSICGRRPCHMNEATGHCWYCEGRR